MTDLEKVLGILGEAEIIEVADRFEVSVTTMKRWRDGKSAPGPRVSANVVEYVTWFLLRKLK